MTFHGSQWGFRAAAARLFLAPVITGLVAGGAGAQAPARTQTQTQATARAADPQDLLKQGRAALKAGMFDQAVDLAKRADATNASGRWGLFDDTPESLEKDVAAGRVKAGKAEAEKLARSAKELYSKPTRTPGERIANLDQAHQLADKAMALSGPADFFDDIFGGSDRPEKLKKDIDAARAAVRKANPGVVTAAATKPAGAMASGITQAGATAKPGQASPVMTAGAVMPPPNMPALPTPATDAERQNAAKLVAAGRDALKVGKYAEAKALAVKAQAMNPAAADGADALARDAAAAGKVQIDRLAKDAAAATLARDTPKAEAALADAKALAAGLGFQTKPYDDQLAQLRGPAITAPVLPNPSNTVGAIKAPDMPALPGGTLVTETQTKTVGLEPTPGRILPRVVTTETTTTKLDVPGGAPSLPSVGLPSVPVVNALAPAAPSAPTLPVAPPTVAPIATPAAPAAPGVLTGEQLLTQARSTLARGDAQMAKNLAVRSFNMPGVNKDDAMAVMREADAELSSQARTEATATLKNATTAVQQKQYAQALATLKLINPAGLTSEQKVSAEQLAQQAEAEVAKVSSAPALTVPAPTAPSPTRPLTGETTPAKAAADIEVQKLRSEALDTERKANEAYKRGETDVAIEMVNGFVAKVEQSGLPTNTQERVTGSLKNRLRTMQAMKKQTDFYVGEAKDRASARDRTVGKQLAEQQKAEDLKKKSVELTELIKAKKYREAEELAQQMKNLAPDDVAVNTMHTLVQRQRREDQAKRLKGDREELFYEGLTAAERVGPTPTDEMPLIVDANKALSIRGRTGDSEIRRMLTPTEREIEMKLERPLTVSFKNRPLRDAIADIRDKSNLNITTDDASIAESLASIDTVTVTEELKDLSVRNVLEILLDKARLKFVVENNVVRVTTEKRAQGKLITKVFSVMELVTPVPDFALADHQSMAKALKKNDPNPAWAPDGKGGSRYSPAGGMPQTGAELRSDGRVAGMAAEMDGAANQIGPMASSATLATHGRTNHSAQLTKLIKGMVKPYSWAERGGAGEIGYYDIGGALVVNQTADVIGEVQQLLESLRRLQEVSVSVEIRVVSLSESFFERIGVDFAMNIKTNKNQQFERSLTTGQFAAEPFVNDINVNNVTVGYNPTAGGFTSDLDVPVRTNTYGLGIPPFGGYPGPGNGGLGLGLAFLNDIQVFMFMEAASGDRRVNIMQAPKITLFNGQTSTVFVSDFAFFTTGLDVINVGGQFVYIPRNTPFPIGNSFAPPGTQQGQQTPGVAVAVQAIVSADRRFVRLNLSPTLTSLTSATVPLFPVTAFITPVFEGGSQGVPIPFTQFFQQPSISEINVSTTVAVPDGGTVVLGGLKTMAEGRNEFGPPVLSQLPYVNRLFRNQGIGRETRHIMIMVTPRIIIQSEEELNQTGGGVGLPGTGGQ